MIWTSLTPCFLLLIWLVIKYRNIFKKNTLYFKFVVLYISARYIIVKHFYWLGTFQFSNNIPRFCQKGPWLFFNIRRYLCVFEFFKQLLLENLLLLTSSWVNEASLTLKARCLAAQLILNLRWSRMRVTFNGSWTAIALDIRFSYIIIGFIFFASYLNLRFKFEYSLHKRFCHLRKFRLRIYLVV